MQLTKKEKEKIALCKKGKRKCLSCKDKAECLIPVKLARQGRSAGGRPGG